MEKIDLAQNLVKEISKGLIDKGLCKNEEELLEVLRCLRVVTTCEINKLEKPLAEDNDVYNNVVLKKQKEMFSNADIEIFANDVRKNLHYDYSKYSFDPALVERIKDAIHCQQMIEEFGYDLDRPGECKRHRISGLKDCM